MRGLYPKLLNMFSCMLPLHNLVTTRASAGVEVYDAASFDMGWLSAVMDAA